MCGISSRRCDPSFSINQLRPDNKVAYAKCGWDDVSSLSTKAKLVFLIIDTSYVTQFVTHVEVRQGPAALLAPTAGIDV